MKTFSMLLLGVMSIAISTSCSGQSESNETLTAISNTNKVEVYYFHFTRRCATCNAVESVSKEAVAELYGDQVSFASFNLDEQAGEAKGEELGVSGQTLLIVAGDTRLDITSEGFLYARSQPEKLKALIKEKTDPLL